MRRPTPFACGWLIALSACANPVIHKKAERRLPSQAELKPASDEFIERALAPPGRAGKTGLYLDDAGEYWYEATFDEDVSASDLQEYRKEIRGRGLYYRVIGPSGHNPFGNILRYEQCVLRKVERKQWAVAVACFWTSDLPGNSEGYTDAPAPYHRDGRRILVYLGAHQFDGVWKVAQPIPDRDRISIHEPFFGRPPDLFLTAVQPPANDAVHWVTMYFVSQTRPLSFYLEEYFRRFGKEGECSWFDQWNDGRKSVRCQFGQHPALESVWVESCGVFYDLPGSWEKVRPDLARELPPNLNCVHLSMMFRSDESAKKFLAELKMKAQE